MIKWYVHTHARFFQFAQPHLLSRNNIILLLLRVFL